MTHLRTKRTKKPHTIKHALHLCCDNYGGRREQMGNIEFHSGFAWATNAHIAIKIPTNEIFDIDKDTATKLDGKSIKREYWQMIKGKRVKVTEDGQILFSPHAKIEPCVPVPMLNPEFARTLQEMIEGVLPSDKDYSPVKQIGINSQFLLSCCKAMNLSYHSAKLSFCAENKAIVIGRTGFDEPTESTGIIMPVMIDHL